MNGLTEIQKHHIRRYCLMVLSQRLNHGQVRGIGLEKKAVTSAIEVSVYLTNEPEGMHTNWYLGSFSTEGDADEFVTKTFSFAVVVLAALEKAVGDESH